jgi:mRNA interferase MazF
MKRGEVYDTRLDPVEGSEQSGTRPVVIVSRDSLHNNSSIALVVPFTTARPNRHIYATQVLVHAPEGGLTANSIALAEQARGLHSPVCCGFAVRLGRIRSPQFHAPWLSPSIWTDGRSRAAA